MKRKLFFAGVVGAAVTAWILSLATLPEPPAGTALPKRGAPT